jgi:hypothetical protein
MPLTADAIRTTTTAQVPDVLSIKRFRRLIAFETWPRTIISATRASLSSGPLWRIRKKNVASEPHTDRFTPTESPIANCLEFG